MRRIKLPVTDGSPNPDQKKTDLVLIKKKRICSFGDLVILADHRLNMKETKRQKVDWNVLRSSANSQVLCMDPIPVIL